jgi:hypothetical protein
MGPAWRRKANIPVLTVGFYFDADADVSVTQDGSQPDKALAL